MSPTKKQTDTAQTSRILTCVPRGPGHLVSAQRRLSDERRLTFYVLAYLRKKHHHTLHSNPDLQGRRGRHRKLTEAQLQQMEQLMAKNESEGRTASWQELLDNADIDVDVSTHTLRRCIKERQRGRRQRSVQARQVH